MKEIWKDIPGYEGLYKVSDLGNIINNKGRLLKQTKGKCYLKIELWSKKLKQKRKSFSTLFKKIGKRSAENLIVV